MVSIFDFLAGAAGPAEVAPAPPEAATVAASDGFALAYDEFGSAGPAIVLLHDFGQSRHFWDLSVRPISRTCRVVAYDQRFHGRSERSPYGAHLARAAADLRDVVEALSLGPVTLVGAGAGTDIALAYLELFGTSAVAGLVAVGPTPVRRVREDWRVFATRAWDGDTLARLQDELRRDLAGWARRGLSAARPGALEPEATESLTRETLLADPPALCALAEDLLRVDWRPLLRTLRVPTLVLTGLADREVDPAASAAFAAALPDSRHVALPDLTHLPFLEDPATFSLLVAEFARSAGGIDPGAIGPAASAPGPGTAGPGGTTGRGTAVLPVPVPVPVPRGREVARRIFVNGSGAVAGRSTR